jgi:hypothetical protein
MIERTGSTEELWLANLGQLETPEARAAAMKGTVEDWATESLLTASQAYQVAEPGTRLKPGQKLADAYLEAKLPVVRRRPYHAGTRWTCTAEWRDGDAHRRANPQMIGQEPAIFPTVQVTLVRHNRVPARSPVGATCSAESRVAM